MSNLSRLARLEAQRKAHIEALAEALALAHDDVLKHVPDAQLRLMVDGAIEFTDGAQWYDFLQHDCAVPVDLIERLRRADDAIRPHSESAIYKAWEARYQARIAAEIAELSAPPF